jgi:hypothetical protein
MGAATALKREQDDWCRTALSAPRLLFPPYASEPTFYPANDMKLQALVDILRGDVDVHAHCYETGDIEAMLRTADEFGYNLTALHHATETWRMIGQLSQRRPMYVALFAEEASKRRSLRG